MESLEGKVAVITGASRGLGKAMAEAFTGAGAKVVLSSRSREEIEQIVAQLREKGAEAAAFVCDVTEPKQLEDLACSAILKYGDFDIWINNAGIGGPFGPTLDISPHDFLTVLRTNMLGTYYGSITAMRHFLPKKSGKLINM